MEQTKLFTKEQYQAIKAAWAERKNHDATDHIIYNALRGLPLDRGFTPIGETNHNKIRSNEEDRWHGFNVARRYAPHRFGTMKNGMLALFEQDKIKERWGVVPPQEIRDLLKEIPRHG